MGYFPTLHAISADNSGAPIDITPPVITLLGVPHVIVYQNQPYTDAGATATDTVDGNLTGSIVITNAVDTSTVGTYDVTYNVSDSSSNAATPVVREVDVLAPSTTQSTVNTNQDVTIFVPTSLTNGTLDLSYFQPGVGATSTTVTNTVTITAQTNTGNATISIPAGITMTANGDSWDGIINLPQPVTSPVVTPSTGHTASVVSSIEIGLGDTPMTFDKGVRILFPGDAGDLVGWTRAGSFTPTTAICADDSQATGDALSDGADCKMNVGDDLVVWTKHFTTYVVYTEAAISSGGGGGGGGGFGGGVATVVPTALSGGTLDFTIDGGATATASSNLTIAMNANPATVANYVISTDPTIANKGILPYAASTTFALPNIPGTYTVYLKYYSITGTQSWVISHAITYSLSATSTSSGSVSTGGSCGLSAPAFARSLSQGSTGADVKALQQFLNAQGFTIDSQKMARQSGVMAASKSSGAMPRAKRGFRS